MVENAKLLAVFSGSMTEGERNYGSLLLFYQLQTSTYIESTQLHDSNSTCGCKFYNDEGE